MLFREGQRGNTVVNLEAQPEHRRLGPGQNLLTQTSASSKEVAKHCALGPAALGMSALFRTDLASAEWNGRNCVAYIYHGIYKSHPQTGLPFQYTAVFVGLELTYLLNAHCVNSHLSSIP